MFFFFSALQETQSVSTVNENRKKKWCRKRDTKYCWESARVSVLLPKESLQRNARDVVHLYLILPFSHISFINILLNCLSKVQCCKPVRASWPPKVTENAETILFRWMGAALQRLNLWIRSRASHKLKKKKTYPAWGSDREHPFTWEGVEMDALLTWTKLIHYQVFVRKRLTLQCHISFL